MLLEWQRMSRIFLIVLQKNINNRKECTKFFGKRQKTIETNLFPWSQISRDLKIFSKSQSC